MEWWEASDTDNDFSISDGNDWSYQDDSNILDGLGGLFSSALTLTGDYYQAQNQFELQKLQAERESVSYNQQVPVYSNNNNNVLIYAGVAVVGLVVLIVVLK